MTIDASGGALPAQLTPAQTKLMQAAHDLEAVFYGQLLQAMRATVPEGGIFQQSTGEKMFTSMLDDEVSKMASNQTDRGLATALYHQLARQLPATTPAVTAVTAPVDPTS
ncbi:MAG TPA: rod-binding protein [Gemmatimonadales bacterium]|jgi:Rod binding domain-containing protein